jgi:hypothetical protein
MIATPAARYLAIEGRRSIGEIAAEIIADLAFRHAAQKLCAQGPRVVAEFLAELAAERMLRVAIEAKLQRYIELDPVLLEALAARDFPRPPLRVVSE